MAGLVIRMFCENNAIDFVEVAKDLLKEDNSVVTESLCDLGLSVCRRMVSKKLFVKNKYGATFMYPQRFRYCWQQSWFTKMLDMNKFRKQKATVALERQRVMDNFCKFHTGTGASEFYGTQ
jgi:hypothetical protein